jgi:hypothetical protein
MRAAEETLAFCAEVVHLLIMLLEVLACDEPLCECVSVGFRVRLGRAGSSPCGTGHKRDAPPLDGLTTRRRR